MDKESLVKLTGNLYRLTLLFPKKEPLRYKIREAAVGILTKPNEKDIDTLERFLEVALIQNWVSPSEILAMKKEYNDLKTELNNPKEKESKKEEKNPEEKTIIKTQPISQNTQPVVKKEINSRQEKILEFLKENGRAQVWQIKQIMPDITKRTLRRDFEHMLQQEIIDRIGERNDTFYQIRREQA